MGLSLQNIDKIVGREIHLKDINLEFESGSRNVLLGRTLAGKTSLLRIMAGIDRPYPWQNSDRRQRHHRRMGAQTQCGHGLSAIHQLPVSHRL